MLCGLYSLERIDWPIRMIYAFIDTQMPGSEDPGVLLAVAVVETRQQQRGSEMYVDFMRQYATIRTDKTTLEVLL